MLKLSIYGEYKYIDELDVHINSISNILNKLIEYNIVVKEKKEGTNRITYRYIRIHDTFVEQL